jgi:hypothetical protein
MTYSAITDTGYTGYPRSYTRCPVCGKPCRRIIRHVNKQHREVKYND